MKYALLVAVVALSLAGCATTEKPVITTVIQKVEIPIAVPCKVEIPTKPEFNFDKLTEQQDIFEKVKAMLADLKLHMGYEEELNAALSSCVK
jgi:hypothetical protein